MQQGGVLFKVGPNDVPFVRTPSGFALLPDTAQRRCADAPNPAAMSGGPKSVGGYVHLQPQNRHVRQTVDQGCPSRAAVSGVEDADVRGRIQSVGIGRIHRDVVYRSIRQAGADIRPGCPAVNSVIDVTADAWESGVGYVGGRRNSRTDRDLGDGPARQSGAYALPGGAGAGVGGRLDLAATRARVEYLVVGGRYRDRSDSSRSAREIGRDGLPRAGSVRRLVNAVGPEEERRTVTRVHNQGRNELHS